jgi:hypothetical protein
VRAPRLKSSQTICKILIKKIKKKELKNKIRVSPCDGPAAVASFQSNRRKRETLLGYLPSSDELPYWIYECNAISAEGIGLGRVGRGGKEAYEYVEAESVHIQLRYNQQL